MSEKIKVEITLLGCDDETCFEYHVTAEQLDLLQGIAEKSKKYATYQCKPEMIIEKKED